MLHYSEAHVFGTESFISDAEPWIASQKKPILVTGRSTAASLL